MSSKKASAIHLYILLSLIIAISIGIVMVTFPQKSITFSREIGEVQIALLNAYNKAEQILLYLDLSAKYSAYNALNQLEKNSWFVSESACGSYLGYNLLNNKDEYCLPSKDINQAFKALFDEKLAIYLKNYPHAELDTEIYDDYILKEEDGRIAFTGFAKSDIKVDAWSRKGERFEKEIETEVLKEKSPVITGECPSAPPANLGFVKDDNCVGKNCYIRKEVKERLELARNMARQIGADILLNSGWRNYCEQELLYEKYGEGRAAEPGKSPHHTGGAIDVRLTGNGLDCGVITTDKGRLDSYRDSASERGKQIHECRTRLKEIMEEQGFVNYGNEWWHWEHGTTRWAVAKKQEAKFEIVT